MAADRLWRAQPRAFCQRYEDMVANPAGAIAATARHLGLPSSAAEATAIAVRYSRDANLQRIAELRQRRAAQAGADAVGEAARRLAGDLEVPHHGIHGPLVAGEANGVHPRGVVGGTLYGGEPIGLVQA